MFYHHHPEIGDLEIKKEQTLIKKKLIIYCAAVFGVCLIFDLLWHCIHKLAQ